MNMVSQPTLLKYCIAFDTEKYMQRNLHLNIHWPFVGNHLSSS